MKLSVVIVNYNVKYFLEQCLLSVNNAAGALKKKHPGYDTEIIVVDNNSVDSSVIMLKEKFSSVSTILNKENLGYSKANNQAIRKACGEYILLLNPDTVLEENTFISILEFADSKDDFGGLGVKMLDGSGNFLPESKRGLPTPGTAFFKITGLSKLFPKSRVFGKYHLHYLDQDKIHEVDILSGAFMLLKKSVLEKTGLLDEDFFMYGEDIDLSYRIKKNGYKNYYFPDTQIIHYKGESTKRGSLNYVFLFYKAMIIFARKHFSSRNASLFSFFINIAIIFRAALSVIKRFVIWISLPLTDAVFIFGGLWLSKYFWENNEVFGHGVPYPPELVKYIFPLYILFWLLGLLVLRNYLRPFRLKNIVRGVLLGTLMVSAVYAFFEESFRFSRAIIILGTFTTFFVSVLSRVIFNYIENGSISLSWIKEARLAIVGTHKESEHVRELLNKFQTKFILAGFICPEKTGQSGRGINYLGTVNNIDEIVAVHKINELVFCSKDISSKDTIAIMTRLSKKDIAFKIAPSESLFVIGSKGKNESGDYYTIDIELPIAKTENRFNKRMFDITISVMFLILSPALIFFQKSIGKFYRACVDVLLGKKTWISYFTAVPQDALPVLKQGVFPPEIVDESNNVPPDLWQEKNLLYARNYTVMTDLYLLMRQLNKLGG